MKELSSDYEHEFDLIKAWAIFLVILSHLLSMNSFGSRACFAIHNQAFFVISGYFVNASIDKGYLRFFRNKIYRLLIPYLTWSALGGIVRSAFCLTTIYDINNIKFFLYNIIDTIIYAKSVWFFVSLFCVNIIFCIVYRFFNEFKYEIAYYMLGYILLWLLSKTGTFGFNYSLWMYPFFVFGYALKKYGISLECSISKMICCVVISVMVIYLGEDSVYLQFSNTDCEYFGKSVIYFIVGIVLFYLLYSIAISLLKKYNMSLWKKIGKRSIAIYPLSIFFTQYLARNITIKSYLSIIIALVILLVCYYIDVFFSNMNIYSFLTGRKVLK